METVTPVSGDREGCGEGRVVRREIVVNRTNEGDMALSVNMKNMVSIATSVDVDMTVVEVVTGHWSLVKKQWKNEKEKLEGLRNSGDQVTQTPVPLYTEKSKYSRQVMHGGANGVVMRFGRSSREVSSEDYSETTLGTTLAQTAQLMT
jgi:hypothetical protein